MTVSAKKKGNTDSIRYLTAFLLIAAGAFLRFSLLGRIPFGLNHDEASIGYDAFTLANYGIDRNGYPWPVYPITWGSGGGSPLMVYLTVLSTKLLGRSIFSLRFFPALLGSLTGPLLALIPAASRKERALQFSLFLLFLIAINPWHLMLSRWALDSNTLPFFLTLAVLSYVYAAGRTGNRTAWYLLSAALFALCPYAYGSATIVIPVTLVIVGLVTIAFGRMRPGELLLSALVFLIVMSPLLVFFALNALGRPAIVTPWFSVPVLTAERSVFFFSKETLAAHIKDNIRYLIIFFTTGAEEGEILCNYIPGYAQMYRFTFPLTFIGIFLSVRALVTKKSIPDLCMLALTGMTVVFTLFIEPDINRMTLLLIPFIYDQALALDTLFSWKKPAAWILVGVLCCAAAFFVRDYYGEKYAGLSSEWFMPGYTEAVHEAVEAAGTDRPILSTYEHLSAPFILALYEAETPPQRFLDTVVWKDPDAEFRVASSFDRFTFGLPDDLSSIDPQTVLILHTSELSDFPKAETYHTETFGNFAVLYN